MGTLSLPLVLVTMIGWCVLAGRLGRAGLTAPIVFVGAGFLFADPLNVLHLTAEPELVKVITEVTLVWVLFGDASKVQLSQFRGDLAIYGRLLGAGFPLTLALGTVVAIWVLDIDPWSALLLGATLAPTDAALGASVMSNPRVPDKVRRALNVESGLNDGIATPIVVVAIAGVAEQEGIASLESPGGAAFALALGAAAGILVGGVGGFVTRGARRRGWLPEDLGGPAVLALALLSYTLSVAIDGNGFVAAFVAGLVFGNVAGRGGEREVYFVEQSASIASMISWLIFGAFAVPVIGQWSAGASCSTPCSASHWYGCSRLRWRCWSRFRPTGVLFIGWFGPRGLASVIFALLALEGLGTAAQELVAGHLAHGASQRRAPWRHGGSSRESVPAPRTPMRRVGSPFPRDNRPPI